MTDTRSIIVTGAGTGIGRATARRFAAEGARVLAVGRRIGPLRETAGHLPGITPFAGDVTTDAEGIVAAALRAHGRLDVLVNNAGIGGGSAIGAITAAEIAASMAVNFTAPVLLGQAAVPHLPEGGVIVNVSTAIGQRGWDRASTYAAAKAAVDSLTRSWALELAPRGIRVNAVAPGPIETPIATHMGLSPEQAATVRDWQIAHTPLRRRGTAEEVAWAITRLASPEASFVTGAVLPVDGGAVVG